MRLSIILPCLNEIRHGYLENIMENLIAQEGEIEIIAVVSESDDQTEAFLLRYEVYPQVKVMRSLATNRAQRLNEGIVASQGEVVLLHHPATILPEKDVRSLIEEALSSGESWGAFYHSFDFSHWLLRFTSWYSNHVRVKRKGIIYFDHCPFIKRQLLEKVGNVPDLDIFEDTVFSDRLCQFAKPVLVNAPVITSARRFRQRGIYRHALLNQWLKLCYHLNIDPKFLNRLYEKRYSINTTYK
ncbi:MAG: glycosyl transferase [Pseudanabaena sp.]|nr:MAG: glycosyl transferase [Pseudanabaena sp.]